jgi:hypothetical protein
VFIEMCLKQVGGRNLVNVSDVLHCYLVQSGL